jgi:hypothetical protein
MRNITTKHGHQWVLPETVGEFQNAGVNLDEVCRYAGLYLYNRMASKSNNCIARGEAWTGDFNKARPRRSTNEMSEAKKQRIAKKVVKITTKLTAYELAALKAELLKEDK